MNTINQRFLGLIQNMPENMMAFNAKQRRALFLILAGIFSLTACSENSNTRDLQAFIDRVQTEERPAVDPLPTIRPTESFSYTASEIVSPFSSDNVLPEQKLQLEVDPVLPDQDRLRQPLEYFPLDSLKMVGTLKQKNQIYAIVFAPDDTVHRVSIGNFAGMQLGEIIKVSDGEIVLEETIKLKSGQWEKRKVSIALITEK